MNKLGLEEYARNYLENPLYKTGQISPPRSLRRSTGRIRSGGISRVRRFITNAPSSNTAGARGTHALARRRTGARR